MISQYPPGIPFGAHSYREVEDSLFDNTSVAQRFYARERAVAALGQSPGRFGACPAPVAPSPPGPPPPRPKYQRYSDPSLQEAYARIVAVLREKAVPVVGNIFSEDEADRMARNAVDAVRAMPQSKELQASVRCAITPIITPYVVGIGGAILLSLGLSFMALKAARRA